MALDILKNQELYKKYFENYVNRDGVDKLIAMLERTDFFVAPASKRYHLSEDGGLNQHSLNVLYSFLEQIQLKASLKGYDIFDIIEKVKRCEPLTSFELSLVNEALPVLFETKKLTLETVVVVCLCHDFHKINIYKRVVKRLPNDKGDWVDTPVWYSADDPFVLGDAGTNSWYLASTCIKLSYEEILAIENHMGYTAAGNPLPGSSGGWKKSSLALYLHLCDMIATFEVER